ncbi:restriction endonuclease subunit S [Empedobacter sp. UBA7252]|nr:restriction endonuclease subunit S [Empedobacter sp. UBA7252]
MSKIEELIAQYCPDGVKFGTIGTVASCYAGATPKTGVLEFWEGGTIPWMSSGEVNKGFVYDTEKKITQLGYEKSSTKIVPSNTVVIALAGQGKTRGMVALTKISLCTNQSLCSIISKETIKSEFLYYFLKTQYKKLRDISSGDGTRGGLNLQMIREFLIPIPPLPIQKEIVNILDKFTALEAELEAELEARKRQYEYYRNELLSFEGKEVAWKTLGEIGEFIRGSGLQKTDFRESGVGCIHYGQIYTYYGTSATETKSFVSEELAMKLRKAKKGDLVIAGVSENIEDVCKAVVWLGDEEICISGDSWAFRHNQNPKFIGYLLQTDRFLEFKKKYAQGAKVTRLRSGSLPTFIVPIPPLEDQECIVAILDKFDALVNDISVGLPAEITARRQQYEYYRGKLLTFEPLAVAQ